MPSKVETNLFSGMHVAFVVKTHLKKLMSRISDLGGVIDDEINDNTTHIVCPREIQEDEIRRSLPQTKPRLESYNVVTPDFFSASMLAQTIQQEENFRPEILHLAETKGLAANRGRRNDFKSVGERQSKRPKITSSHVNKPREPSELHCIDEHHGSRWVAVQGTLPEFTGGHCGIPWGSCGVWDEPYDLESASQTVEALRNHWYSTKSQGHQPQFPETFKSLTSNNEICKHASCAKRQYCLVRKLEDYKRVYLEGRDYYKIKAIDKAQQQLMSNPIPLDTDEDVDKLGMGAKSKEKVKELLRHGSSQRVENVSHNEKMSCLSEFCKIWGVGPRVAEGWYTNGCRSLKDVKEKAMKSPSPLHPLTEQQQVGLKYADEFKLKIPRKEVSNAEDIVREETFNLVESLGAVSDSEQTYVFATGSYRRGSPESSDIDILIVLPPSLSNVPCGQFLQHLLARLLDANMLSNEMNPLAEQLNAVERSSWLGVCMPPGSSIHRRIDFKVYHHKSGACAVNYFANSESFCRATRYWARTASVASANAKKYHPDASGFKLSDREMVPIKRKLVGHSNGKRRLETDVEVLGPPLKLQNGETDIFEALGLSYVPVTMRYFHDYF
jgi:DNA polymerase/3'-5' exonuclease PolX